MLFPWTHHLLPSRRNIPQLDGDVPEPDDPGLDDPGLVGVARSVPPDDVVPEFLNLDDFLLINIKNINICF